MKKAIEMKRFAGVFCLALAALTGVAESSPWGWAYEPDKEPVALTNRTSTGGAVLTNAELSVGCNEIRFKGGEVKVARIELAGRDIRFVGGGAGTTLVPDGTAMRQFGGAIEVLGGSAVVSNLVFEGCFAETAGGALALRELEGDSAVVGCRFVGCGTDDVYGKGGAIYASSKAGTNVVLGVVGSQFEECYAGNGGAISADRIYFASEDPIALDVVDSTFAKNDAYASGGAVCTEGDAAFSGETLFEDNVAGGDGGAVCVGSAASEETGFAGAAISCSEGVVFRNNRADVFEGEGYEYAYAYGGAVALKSPGIVFSAEKTAFFANAATTAGGAVHAWEDDAVVLSTCVFSNNVVSAVGQGGAIDIELSSLAMTNVTVRGSNRDAVILLDAAAHIVNCVIVNGETSDSDIKAYTLSAAPNVNIRRSAFGTYADNGKAANLSTNECLVGCTEGSIFEGTSLFLKGEPYNPAAAEGIVQSATDFVGVEYGSEKYGFSMGAYECTTVASVSSEPFEGVYDGKGHSITVNAGTAFSPVVWRYRTEEGALWSDVKPAFTNVGVYTVWASATSDVFVAEMVTSNTVTITNRIVLLRSASATKVYDTLPLTTNDAWVAATSANSLAAGDFLAFDCTGSRTNVGTNENVFACSITNASGDVTGNYAPSHTNGLLIVTKRKLGEEFELFLDATNFPYRAIGQGPTLTNDYITVDGVKFPVDMFDVVGNVGTNVGGYALTLRAKPENAENFEGEIEVPWCITKAKLVVTPGAEDVMYGAEKPAYKWTATGYQGADTADDIDDTRVAYTCAYEAGWKVGTHENAVTVAGLASPNYDFEYKPGDLVVRKRRLTLTPPTKDKTYDGKELTFGESEITPEDEGYYADERLKYSKFASITEVGTVDATFAYENGTADLANYEVTVTTGKTLTVNPAEDQVVVEAASMTWCYDGKAHSTNGWSFVNDKLFLEKGDEFIGEIDTENCKVTTPDEGIVSNLFKTAMIVRYTNETRTAYIDMSKAYKLVKLPGELAVTNAQIRVLNLGGLGCEKLYNGNGHTIGDPEAVQQDGRPATVRYSTAKEGPYSADKPSFTNASDTAYAVWFEASAPYHDSVTNSATVKINRRKVFFDSPTQMEYDKGQTLEAAPFLTDKGDGFAEGEGYDRFENLATQKGVGSCDATYDVVYSNNTDVAVNYTVTRDYGKLIILEPGSLAVTAASGEWTFNGRPHSTNDYTKVGEMKHNDDTLEVVFDPLPAVTYPDEGTVENLISTVRVWRAGVDVTTNYVIRTFPGTLKVNPFDGIEMSVEGAEKTYDGKGTNITVRTRTQLDGGEATVRYSRTADGSFVEENPSFSNVCEEAVWAVASARGYVSKTNSAVVKINKRPVTIKTAGGSWTYEKGVERMTNAFVSVTGFVGSDGIATTNCTGRITTVGTTDNTATYVLTPTTRAENYTISVEPGILEVTPAEMEGIVVEGYDRPYDGRKHRISVDMQVPYDGATIEYAPVPDDLALGPDNPPYADVVTTTTWARVKAPNYRTVYTNADVRITPVTLTVKADDVTLTWGDEKPAEDTYTITGFVNNELEKDVVTGAPALNNQYVQWTTKPGDHPGYVGCTVGTLAAKNYTFDCQPGDVTVERGTIRHSVEAPVVPYDGLGTNITVEITDNPPPETGVTFKKKFRTPEGAWLDDLPPVYTNAGTYEITYVIEDGEAFDPVTNTVKMVITPRKITLKSPDKSKVYDGEALELFADDIGAGGMGFAPGERFAFDNRASRTDVGTSKATFTPKDGTALLANYAIEKTEYGWLTVDPAQDQILVRSASGIWTYDGAPHGTNGYEVIGFEENKLDPADEIVVELFGSTQTIPGETANRIKSAEIMRGGKAVTKSYNRFKTEAGTLTVVNAKFDEPTVTPYRRVYDGAAHGIEVVPPAVKGGVTVDVTYPETGNSFTAVTNAVVKFTMKAQYYDTYCGESTVDILPRKVCFTSASDMKVYDGQPLVTDTSRITLDGSFVAGETHGYENLGAITEVGVSNATFDVTFGTAKESNYEIEKVPGLLVVCPSNRVSVVATNATHVFDGQAYTNHGYTVVDPLKVLPVGYTVDPVFDEKSVITLPGSVENRILSARFYTNGVEVVLDKDPLLIPGRLTVTKAVFADVVANPTNVVYDGSGYSITVEEPAAKGTGPVTISYSTVSDKGPFQLENPTFVAARDTPYRVFFKVTAPGYEDYVGESYVRVRRRTVTLVSASETRVYDAQALSNGTVSVTNETTLAACDALSAVATGSLTDVGTVGNAFNAAIVEAETQAADRLRNYDVTLEYGELEVTPYKLDVTFEANDKVYDSTTTAIWSRVYLFAPTADMAKSMPIGQGFELGDAGVKFWFDNPNVQETPHKVTAVKFGLSNVSGTNDVSKTCNYLFKFCQTTQADIIPAGMPPIDPDDPQDPTDPKAGPFPGPNLDPTVNPPPPPVKDGVPVKLSNYDVTTNYDGEAHTFDTNALVAKLEQIREAKGFLGNEYTLEYSLTGEKDTWRSASETYDWVNVVATSFWYRVTVPNYSNYIHAAGVTVTNRCVTLRSGSKVAYLPKNLAEGEEITVTNHFAWVESGSFVTNSLTGEEDWFAVTNWIGTLTGSAKCGPVPNDFQAAELPLGARNYALTCLPGELAIEDYPGPNSLIYEDVPDATGRGFIRIIMDNTEAGDRAADMPVQLRNVATNYVQGVGEMVKVILKVSDTNTWDALNWRHYDSLTNAVVTNAVAHGVEQALIERFRYTAFDITLSLVRETTGVAETNDIGHVNHDLLTINVPAVFDPKIIDVQLWRNHTWTNGTGTVVTNDEIMSLLPAVSGVEYCTTNAIGYVLCMRQFSELLGMQSVPATPLLTGNLWWKFHQSGGVFCGSLDAVCTNGDAKAIANLCYIYEDRTNSVGSLVTYLRHQTKAEELSRTSKVVFGGATFGKYVLDDLAARLRTSEVGTTCHQGVAKSRLRNSVWYVPAAERNVSPLLVTRNKAMIGETDVEDSLGYLAWQEEGKPKWYCHAFGKDAAAINGALALAEALNGGTERLSSAPLAVGAANRVLAYGLPPLADGSDPELAIERFDVGDAEISGRVVTCAGGVTGVPGGNVTVEVLGADSVNGDYAVVATPAVDAQGGFTFAKPTDARFFKVRLTVIDVIK